MEEQDDNLDQDYENAFDEFASDEPAESEEQFEQEPSEEESHNAEVQEEKATNQVSEVDQLKAEIQKWQHRYNSDIGRVNAYQRKIQELESQVKQPAKGDNPEGSGMTDKEWEQLKQDYPDIASAFEKKLGAIESKYEEKFGAISNQMRPLNEMQQQQYRQSQLQALESVHPDWREVVQTPDYSQWLQAQPPEIQQFMNSMEADRNIFLLNSYKAATGKTQAASSNLQSRKQRQLQQARTVPNRSQSTGRNLNTDDYESAFDYYAEKIR